MRNTRNHKVNQFGKTSFILAILILILVPMTSVFGQGSPQVELIIDELNPIFDAGAQIGVDEDAVMDPYILEYDGLYHMFYVSRAEPTSPLAISYATSEDGLVWDRFEGNPIFEADGTGFDFTSVLSPAVLVEDGTWMMYYAGLQNIGIAFGDGIGLATASDPTGTWERLDEPLITVGGVREWDANKIGVDAVFATDDGYMLYYTSNQGNSIAVGLATSTDGITWEKYDDPTTDDRKYVNSDPVFAPSERGNWDDGGVNNPAIRRTDDGFEMVYLGFTNRPGVTAQFFDNPFGYAYSEDGIHWTRYEGNPLWISPTEVAAANPSFFVTGESVYILYTLQEQTNRGPIGGRIDRAELIVTSE